MKTNDPIKAVSEIDAKMKEALLGIEPTDEVKAAVVKYLLVMSATTARSSGSGVDDYLDDAKRSWDDSAAALAQREALTEIKN